MVCERSLRAVSHVKNPVYLSPWCNRRCGGPEAHYSVVVLLRVDLGIVYTDGTARVTSFHWRFIAANLGSTC